MREGSTTSKRGILNPKAAEAHFRLARYEPALDLDFFVERHWTVSWDLRERPPFLQEVLPHPSVNVAFQRGACGVFGVVTQRSPHHLEGKGKVFGTKFRPGAFFPFLGYPVADITNRVLPITDVFDISPAFQKRILSLEEDDLAQKDLVEQMLRERLPERDENVALIGKVVRLVLADREIQRVEDVCDQLDIGVRTIQRLFRKYVGVSPKWVIQRVRLHEAAERIAEGKVANWAALAIEVGYFDQAHFGKDFKALIGKSPTEYAEACAAFAASQRASKSPAKNGRAGTTSSLSARR